MIDETLFITAVIKSGPVGVALLALGFSVWKWILPAIREVYEAKAKMSAAEFDRTEAARRSRDEAWQTSLREIGARHKEATDAAVGGFKDALDRHDKAMDRYAQQHVALAADVSSVKTDVASLKTDVHQLVARFPSVPPHNKE